MDQPTLPQRLSPLQAGNGAFRSRIVYHHHEDEDLNGFATALVLRHLRALPPLPDLQESRARALTFLERCASPVLRGAFSFWPAGERPAWALKVPEDADDTAVITLELALHGRRTLREVRQVVTEVLVPALLTEVDATGPPWIRPVVFPTWLGRSNSPNIVDCCVNVNVAALMSWCGMTHLPGYREACELVERALDWAGDDWQRLRTLTPYYPNPMELRHALEHAVSCGVVELQSPLRRVRALLARHPPAAHLAPPLDKALCGNAYGGPFWLCPALELVRGAQPPAVAKR